MIPCLEEVEKAHIDILPTAFLSSVIGDCMEKGMDVTRGGAHYNLSGYSNDSDWQTLQIVWRL